MFGGSSSRCRGSVCAGSVVCDCGISFLYSLAVLGSLLYLEILLTFSFSVKAAPHECVIRTSQPKALVKAEKATWFYSKVTVSSCATTPSLFSP